MSAVWPYLAAIVPTIIVAAFFYFIVKSMLEGDRRERIAQKKYEQQQDVRSASAEAARALDDGPSENPGK